MYIENSMLCTGFFFALVSLVFSRLEKDRNPIVSCPMIVNWFMNPSSRFVPTFSTPDTFQVQTLTEIYDKTRVYRRIKAGFRGFLRAIFEVSYWSGSRRRHDQETM